MNQATLDLATPPVDPIDRTGFDIGWDHAHHGLVPPAGLLHEGTPVTQGWMAGKAVFGHRTLAGTRATRQWLAVRTLAWRRGIAFEDQQVTPNFLAQIHSERCPVLRTALGGGTDQPDAAVVERLNPQAGYAAGNLAVMSHLAAQARQGVDVLQARRHARAIEAGAAPVAGLGAPAWWRIAVLGSFSTPLPFHEAARLPLAVLPPNRVRLLNTAQGLQALATLLFATPGWSRRCRALADLLPGHTLRHDFNLFVGALAPRVLEAGTDATAVRRALEDAWLQERVQRRWQHLVLSLGEPGTEQLLARAVAQGLAGVRTVYHAPEQATDGWAWTHHVASETGGCTAPISRPAGELTIAAARPIVLDANYRTVPPQPQASQAITDAQPQRRQAVHRRGRYHGTGPTSSIAQGQV
jgi:hypothetical protein